MDKPTRPGDARATEDSYEHAIYEAVAGVVGPEEARRLCEVAETIPHPTEDPERREWCDAILRKWRDMEFDYTVPLK